MAKNILILGDTWAITPCHLWPGGNTDPADWFEFQFLKRGNPTLNRGWGGSANHYMIAQAEVFLNATENTPCEIDLVIWFHSELMRDANRGVPENENILRNQGYDALMDVVGTTIYSRVSALKNRFPKTQWAIIGGHAALRPNVKHLLDWAEFRIDNWREVIAGVPCPESQAFEFLDKSKGSLYDWPGITDDIIQRELVIKDQLLAATTDRSKFYDQSHPAKEPLKDLAQQLITKFDL